MVMVMLISVGSAFAQKPSKKMLRLFDEAKNLYNQKEYEAAASVLCDCLVFDSTFIDARLLLADAYYASDEVLLSAQTNFNSAVMDSSFHRLYFNAGRQYLQVGCYDEATEAFSRFISSNPRNKKTAAVADSLLKAARIAQSFVENAYPVENLYHDTLINTDDDEYVNSLTADRKNLYFTRRHHKEGVLNEDVFVANRNDADDKQFASVSDVSQFFSADKNEAAVSLSPDGNIMFLTVCGSGDSYGSCDIYYSKKIGDNKWSAIKNLGENVNSAFWDSQPCMSSDSRVLFFASTRPDGYGKSDIWYSILNDDGVFLPAKNCGELINTDADELAPYIHYDGQTLYFSSDRYGGLGNLDLYMVDIQSNDTAVNLGFPINDHENQMNLVIEPNGDRIYTSNYSKETNYDIISFDLPEHLKPLTTICKNGLVVDRITKEPIEGAKVDVTNTSQIEDSAFSLIEDVYNRYSETNYKGEFTMCLPIDFSYGITVMAEGYMIYSDCAVMLQDTGVMYVELDKVEVGTVSIVRNINFEHDSYHLAETSLVELKSVAKMIQQNRGRKFEICGHTDDVGLASYNQALSERRAKQVYDYLLSIGVEESSVSYTGYGSTRPISDNDTEEGRASNRRTEIICVE